MVEMNIVDLEESSAGHRGPEQHPFALTNPETGLTSHQVEQALQDFGLNEIPVPRTPLYRIFLRQFTGFLPLLIELASLVSLAVREYLDFGIILCILIINAMVGFYEEYHAKKKLDELAACLDSEVAVRRNSETTQILTKFLVPGDIVLLVGGTIVPADVKWVRGDVMQMDTAALTGEPLPRKYPSKDYGDVLLSGTTVVAGECYGQVIRTGTQTEMGKAQADVLKDKSVRVVSVFQTKIMWVIQLLIVCCLTLVIAVLLVDGLAYNGFKENARQSVLDAVSVLIASIPVALPLVLQVNLALGASFLAKEHHAVVTSIPALQDIASMSILLSDKTGTLTSAKMSVISEKIVAAPGFQPAEVLLYAYLCSNVDKKDDPIDKAVVAAFQKSTQKNDMSSYTQKEMIGFNPNVKRVVAFVQHGNSMISLAKGLPAKILDTRAGGQDDHELQWSVSLDASARRNITEQDMGLSKTGYKTIAVAICEGDARSQPNAVWKLVGLIPLLDPPREDTVATIASLHHANISIKMITGDHVNVGKETARIIGLGEDIRGGEEIRTASPDVKKKLIWDADGFAAVLPSDKREVVLTLRNEFGVVTGMTGDGVNDAPALSAAQVGIAVDGATDAAKNAADLVLTKPGLSPIYGAVLESRRIFARIRGYVIYRVAASLILVLTLSSILFASGCGVEAFLTIILAFLNDVSMIPVAYDHALATSRPQLPNSAKIVYQALFFAVCHVVAGLSFIFWADNNQSLTQPIELNSHCNNETRGFIWFYLVVVTELAIFSVRSPSFFWVSRPSTFLLASVILTCLGSALFVSQSSNVARESLWYIIVYNLFAFVIVDFLKVAFRMVINDHPGKPILSDELVQEDPSLKSNETKRAEKEERYKIHMESAFYVQDAEAKVSIQDERTGLFSRMFGELRPDSISDGFIGNRKRARVLSSAVRSSLFIRKRSNGVVAESVPNEGIV